MFESEEEMQAFAKVIAITIAEQMKSQPHVVSCSLCIDDPDFAKKHPEHHRVISEALEFFSRMNKMKWGVTTVLVSALTITGLSFILLKLWGIKLLTGGG